MNRHGILIKRISLLSVAFLLAVAIGCAPVQTKPTGRQAKTTSVSKGKKEMLKVATQQNYLQNMLMAFADTFAVRFGESTSILLEQEPSRNRVYAAKFRFYTLAAAFDLATSRYPIIGIIEMAILVTLERIVWEDYWQPEVFGDPAQVVVRTLRSSEQDIWAIAAKVLTPEQLNELRALIHEWRKQNPDLRSASFIRLSNILEVVDEDSVFQEETKPGGLFAPITEAADAADEIRFVAERAIYLASRMNAILGMQIEMLYHDIFTQEEVNQILSDITGFREILERLPEQIAEERKNIMRDLESQEKTIRNVVGDIRKMMKDGNDLISLVNETTKSVDIVSERIDTMIRMPSSGRPFDIMDYQNTVLAVSNTLAQAKAFLDEFDELMVSPDWEKRMPLLLELADGFQSEVIAESITYIFVLGLALMIIFFLGMYILVRYASRHVVGLRKEKGTA